MVNTNALADEFNVCRDLIIDQVTEMAFGPHGLPYTGKVICYRDKEKTILKYERAFDKGIPIGRHICYSHDGVKRSFISYNKTNKKHKGVFISNKTSPKPVPRKFWPKETVCSGYPEVCWYEKECLKDDKSCVLGCG